MSTLKIKITIADLNGKLIDTCRQMLSRFDFVDYHLGSILDIECDAVVSPANSFGFMDGGIDMAYSRFFGWHVQQNLQQMIREKHDGELLVGKAEIVATGHQYVPYVIAAPTMRVPMLLEQSINAYLAARAVFLLIQKGTVADGPQKGDAVRDHIHHLALPGLGTGTGAIPSAAFARQLRAAIDDVVLGHRTFPKSYQEATEWHRYMYAAAVT